MTATTVDVDTSTDGTLTIHPRGTLGHAEAVAFRRALVQAIRHERPACLVLDLADVPEVDPLNLGALAAVCHLGDDQEIPVYVDHLSPGMAGRLTAAGVPAHHLRSVT